MFARYVVVVVVLLALPAAGCLTAPAPVTEVTPPAVEAQADSDAAVTRAAIQADSAERAARELTLRVRARGCSGAFSGSGFAIAKRALITSRHVIADASEIQVSTWDGRSFVAAVARIAYYSDLALVVVDGDLPVVGMLAAHDAEHGDRVTVVGYPLGGRQELQPGRVRDYVVGANLGDETQVMRLTTGVQPGSSGGPVLDRNGEVAGVVYAVELTTSQALAIPASAVRELLRSEPAALPKPDC